MDSSAVISSCERYRYALSRIWDKSKPTVLFIGLNPSTADQHNDDPTIKRCKDYAERWGYGGLCMANLFAYRATKPKDMMVADNPIGDENDAWIAKLAGESEVIIAAWGNDGGFLNRGNDVVRLIKNIQCLKINKSGHPAHPLYQLKSAVPMAYKGLHEK